MIHTKDNQKKKRKKTDKNQKTGSISSVKNIKQQNIIIDNALKCDNQNKLTDNGIDKCLENKIEYL